MSGLATQSHLAATIPQSIRLVVFSRDSSRKAQPRTACRAIRRSIVHVWALHQLPELTGLPRVRTGGDAFVGGSDNVQIRARKLVAGPPLWKAVSVVRKLACYIASRARAEAVPAGTSSITVFLCEPVLHFISHRKRLAGSVQNDRRVRTN